MLYPIAILPGNDEHAWGVEVPDIPGCFSAGDDLDDALAMAREAIEGHLELLAEDGAAIPVAQTVTFHSTNPQFEGCIWAMIDIDITRYMGKAGEIYDGISRLSAENLRLNAENAKLAAENAKLTAGRDKLSIEPREGTREIFWYPLGIATALVGSVAAITALALRYLLY